MIGIIVAIIIIFIFYTILNWNTSAYEEYLYGCWLAEDDDFTDEAGIDSMMVFIGKPARSGIRSVTRNCYIIIMTDMANEGFSIEYVPAWGGVGFGKYSIRAKTCFEEYGDDTEGAKGLWDEEVTITVDPRVGTMTVRNGDKVFARLCKQNDITNTANELELTDLE